MSDAVTLWDLILLTMKLVAGFGWLAVSVYAVSTFRYIAKSEKRLHGRRGR